METIKRGDGIAALTPHILNGAGKGTVLIFPGGGYNFVSPREARFVADAYNKEGYNAFVLLYTTRETCGHEDPLLTKPLSEAAWAIAHIRENAAKYSIDPDKIAVCGFSAGGHLAASLGNYWDKPMFFGGEKTPEMYKPNALILCYPVISAGEYRHGGSIKNLAGVETGEAAAPWSMENHISGNTPPAFIWHTAADEPVPVQNSLLFANGLSKHKIPFEMHIFPYGAHGLSLATPEVAELKENRLADPHVAKWHSLSVDWLGITMK